MTGTDRTKIGRGIDRLNVCTLVRHGGERFQNFEAGVGFRWRLFLD